MWQANETLQIASRYSNSGGAFGIPGVTKLNGKIECQKWETCRDRFQTSGAKLPVFWLRTGSQTGENVSAFIDKIETTLKLKKKSQFGPTSCEGAIWVRWAPFWRQYSMRRSLFTALLRASLAYDRHTDNFENTLNNNYEYKYFTYTRVALDHFLEGHTVYTGAVNTGWQNAFYYKTKKELGKFLRKPVKPATP
jgi:hypothetical protein